MLEVSGRRVEFHLTRIFKYTVVISKMSLSSSEEKHRVNSGKMSDFDDDDDNRTKDTENK